MPGNLGLRTLEKLVRDGEIDTVVVAFPDMQGRLMGKRVVASFFLDEVARSGMHACSYLLTVDVAMQPLPGYRLASWASGYADFHALCDMSTLRRIPWLEKTALVLCDLVGAGGQPVEESPRRILRRQLERVAERGYRVYVASELEFRVYRESYDEARVKHYLDLEPIAAYSEDYHIFQTTKEEFLHREIRNGMAGAGIAVECSKGALVSLTRSLAIQFAAHNIRCNIIHPGIVETPMQAPYVKNRATRRAFEASIPLGRIAHPREIAYVALFLASDESSYVTGAEIVADGGFTVS